jgi:hypothetical protein
MAELTEGQIRYRKYKKTYEAYRIKNREHINILCKKYRETHKKYIADIEYNKRDKNDFDYNRKKVLDRDGYKCVLCGMTNEEHIKKWGREITIDHIDGKGRYSKIKNNNIDNLRTLCLSCHGRYDKIRGLNLKQK